MIDSIFFLLACVASGCLSFVSGRKVTSIKGRLRHVEELAKDCSLPTPNPGASEILHIDPEVQENIQFVVSRKAVEEPQLKRWGLTNTVSEIVGITSLFGLLWTLLV